MSDSTLPGCFALGKPLPPNRCDQCLFKPDCQKYVPKSELKKILKLVEEAKAVLQGEKP